MTDSTKQTPPAGAKLPNLCLHDTRTGCSGECSPYWRVPEEKLRSYVSALTPQHLASLGLRRVAEEAGQGERKMLWCGRCGGECELAQQATPAQGGEAPGGGEIQANYSDTNGCIAEPVTTTNSANLPPPTAAPERDAGERCNNCGFAWTDRARRWEKEYQWSCCTTHAYRAAASRPAAPTPEPDEKPLQPRCSHCGKPVDITTAYSVTTGGSLKRIIPGTFCPTCKDLPEATLLAKPSLKKARALLECAYSELARYAFVSTLQLRRDIQGFLSDSPTTGKDGR